MLNIPALGGTVNVAKWFLMFKDLSLMSKLDVTSGLREQYVYDRVKQIHCWNASMSTLHQVI